MKAKVFREKGRLSSRQGDGWALVMNRRGCYLSAADRLGADKQTESQNGMETRK